MVRIKSKGRERRKRDRDDERKKEIQPAGEISERVKAGRDTSANLKERRRHGRKITQACVSFREDAVISPLRFSRLCVFIQSALCRCRFLTTTYTSTQEVVSCVQAFVIS